LIIKNTSDRQFYQADLQDWGFSKGEIENKIKEDTETSANKNSTRENQKR
jgi:hypothetical protein